MSVLSQPQCWFIPADGRREVVVRRTAAIGDALAATCVATKLVEAGYRVRFQAHPDILPMLRRVPSLDSVEEPITPPHVNLDNAYEAHPHRRKVSFTDIFVAAACAQLTKRGVMIGAPTNCAPVLRVGDDERAKASSPFRLHPRPWVVVAARSNSHANRTIPDAVLSQMARAIRGTCFWLANHAHAPEGIVDLNVRSVDGLVTALACADLFVGPDTGPMHIAGALRVPVVALEQASSPDLHLSDQRDFRTVTLPGLGCVNCQHNVCPLPGRATRPPCTEVEASLLSDAVNARLALQGNADSVSCVITTFKATSAMLNRCINAVIDQVDEVIVAKEARGVFPAGLRTHAKLRYVSAAKSELGYGRNMNHGVRHSNGNWLLLLNDDCFLAPDVVHHLLAVGVTDSRIGMVGHLLRYPDGRICHGGKFRTPGMRGWGLYDNRKTVASIKQVRECENVTGTSVLVRRKAFYDTDGFDEDFFAYCDDDDQCLRFRQAGWRIMYCPHATGVHQEATTTAASGHIGQYVRDATALFEKKWAWWWAENIDKVPTF